MSFSLQVEWTHIDILHHMYLSVQAKGRLSDIVHQKTHSLLKVPVILTMSGTWMTCRVVVPFLLHATDWLQGQRAKPSRTYRDSARGSGGQSQDHDTMGPLIYSRGPLLIILEYIRTYVPTESTRPRTRLTKLGLYGQCAEVYGRHVWKWN